MKINVIIISGGSLQNIFNFGNIACLIQGRIKNIFICFLLLKKKSTDMWLQNMLKIGCNYSILNHNWSNYIFSHFPKCRERKRLLQIS